MKHFVVSAPFVGATLVAFIAVLAGQGLLSIESHLLPLPRIVPGSPGFVVIESSPSEPQGAGQSGSNPSQLPPGGTAPTAGSTVRPTAPPSAPTELPVVVSATAGYVEDGRVVLSLGSVARAGASVTVERRLAALSYGACGVFGAWELASANDQLPPGSCGVYRVLVDGAVVYELPEIIRHDGTRPTDPEITVTEVGAREHVAGSTLYLAAGAESLRPVSVTVAVSDPESGLGSVVMSSGGESVTLSDAPWAAELVPAPAGISVTATNVPGDMSSSTFEVAVDGDGPVGGFVDYLPQPAPDGTVFVAYDAGLDVGAGIDASSGVLERRTALLTSEGCGEYGGWNPTPAVDTPSQGRCLQYRYTVRDNVGNEAVYTSPVEVLVPDQTNPTTALLSPADGEIVSGTVEISAEAEDQGSGLRSLAIQLSGAGAEWTTLATGSDSRLSVGWDTLSVEPGSYLLRSVAEDRNGNVGASQPIEVTVAADTTAPSVAIVTPSNGAVLTDASTVEAVAADAESGLRSVTIQARRACGSWSDLGRFSEGPFAVSWDAGSMKPGRYELRAIATDRRGNTTVSASVGVRVERPAEPEPTEPPGEEGDDEDKDGDDDGRGEGSGEGKPGDDESGEGGGGEPGDDGEDDSDEDEPKEDDGESQPVEDDPGEEAGGDEAGDEAEDEETVTAEEASVSDEDVETTSTEASDSSGKASAERPADQGGSTPPAEPTPEDGAVVESS
jgi:Bacterial Ig domain